MMHAPLPLSIKCPKNTIYGPHRPACEQDCRPGPWCDGMDCTGLEKCFCKDDYVLRDLEDRSLGCIPPEKCPFWKRSVRPPEFTLSDVTMAKALPFLSVNITPDVYLITGTSEQTINHRIENESPFPVVVKVLATAPKRFAISKNNFFLDQKSSINVEVKLLNGPVRSHRLDFQFLPCINALNPNWKENPIIAFSTPYKPIVRHVRYKAPRPWTSTVDELYRSNFQISENLSKVFEEAGIFSSKKESINMNEFAILDEAFALNLEKEPVKSSR